jgi:hypothetical protein
MSHPKENSADAGVLQILVNIGLTSIFSELMVGDRLKAIFVGRLEKAPLTPSARAPGGY